MLHVLGVFIVSDTGTQDTSKVKTTHKHDDQVLITD